MEQYFFKELSFYWNDEYDQSLGDETPIPVNIRFEMSSGVTAEEDGPGEVETVDRGGVELACIINAEECNNAPFSVYAVMRGLFRTKEKVSKERMRRYLEINGVAAMFPFLRSAIADLTKASNIPPIILPMTNIHALVVDSKS